MRHVVTLLVSSDATYWPMSEFTEPNRREYCQRLGVNLECRRQYKYAPWGERNLHQWDALHRSEWLWHMDVDSLITNMTIDCRAFCDPAYDLCIANDCNGLNNGVFFLRNSPAGREFMGRVLHRRHLSANDQDAMKHIIATSPNLKVNPVPQRSINAYPDMPDGPWREGDFIIHLPGMPLERRMELLAEYVRRVIR